MLSCLCGILILYLLGSTRYVASAKVLEMQTSSHLAPNIFPRVMHYITDHLSSWMFQNQLVETNIS